MTGSSFFIVNSSHRRANIKVLAEGRNKMVAIAGRVLLYLKHEDIPPL